MVSTPLKNMKISWDDYSQYMEKYILFQTTNQYNMINMYVYMSTINPTLKLQKVQPT